MHKNLRRYTGRPVVAMTDSGHYSASTRERRAAPRYQPCAAGIASGVAGPRVVAALPRAGCPASVAVAAAFRCRRLRWSRWEARPFSKRPAFRCAWGPSAGPTSVGPAGQPRRRWRRRKTVRTPRPGVGREEAGILSDGAPCPRGLVARRWRRSCCERSSGRVVGRNVPPFSRIGASRLRRRRERPFSGAQLRGMATSDRTRRLII
jgi:hypothetical protein